MRMDLVWQTGLSDKPVRIQVNDAWAKDRLDCNLECRLENQLFAVILEQEKRVKFSYKFRGQWGGARNEDEQKLNEPSVPKTSILCGSG